MSLQNPDNIVTEERLAEFYQQILPYMGGMPDVLANKFNRADLYSTDEKIIGRWINGKPLYQKTVHKNGLPCNANMEVCDVPSNMGVLICLEHAFHFSDGATVADNFYSSNSDQYRVWHYNGKIWAGCYTTRSVEAMNASSIDIILQYTKTTDSAVEIGSDTDYSTTEKIVGTWIDGKPIWQKTVDCGALPNSTTKEVDHNISNLDNIITYYGVSRNPTDGNRLILPYLSVGNLSNGVALTVNDTKIRIGTGSSRSAYTSTYVTILYTKTYS